MKLTAAFTMMFLWTTLAWAQSDEIDRLNRVVGEQGKQIDELKQHLAQLERLLLNSAAAVQTTAPAARVVPVSTAVTTTPAPAPPQAAAQPAQPQVAGFRFSGDFRYRIDAFVRGSSPQATGVQNIRQRYRLRFNADRDISSDLSSHMQLATGAVANGLTFDQDFAGGVTRHPFLISEAFLDYHPRPNVGLRGGKVEEVYADNTRFLFDDDVRFNGFNERWSIGPVELRAGQYLFVNPNTFSVSNNSPLTQAGVTPGTIARASQMFHQGITLAGSTNRWRQQFTADIQLFRNPNLIALTSNVNGAGVTVNPAIGLATSGPSPGIGNATSSSTNAILFAPHYQVARAAYRLDINQLGRNPRMPLTWIVQTSRNVGTSQLRDGMLTSISVGRTQEAGEVRGLYAFAIKDANSMISQLTDDDLGSGIGVNVATHHFRFDYAVRRGIVIQNLLFLQTERRSSNPAASFFVPLGRETPRTWRYQGQLAISF